MQWYCETLGSYKRLKTREVKIGNLLLGNNNPIRVQTMTTPDTMDTDATVQQSIRCIEAGSELIRITAPSKNEAENLRNIKGELNKQGYFTPIVADIHFTPNAAEIAAAIIEKVRINPGNYVDKKKFEQIDYTDEAYNEELERIRKKFAPLVKICIDNGTAMRIGTNHGSLSDRIMSRFGDTAAGMVESGMEFLRIARSFNYHNIVLSMKSSNPLVMVQAYRLLINKMMAEFNECYPLHLGVTEAGDGEDGRIKSAIGIGSLLEDGIGDTIRVSLTEDPEFEIPVCNDLVKRYKNKKEFNLEYNVSSLAYNPFEYLKRKTNQVLKIGGKNVPVVVADFKNDENISLGNLISCGYNYDVNLDKWHIGDAAADFIFSGNKTIDFKLPGTLNVICNFNIWKPEIENHFPLFKVIDYLSSTKKSKILNFIKVQPHELNEQLAKVLQEDQTITVCINASGENGMLKAKNFVNELLKKNIKTPVIIFVESDEDTIDGQLIDFSIQAGAIFLDGMGDGRWLRNDAEKIKNSKVSGRTYLPTKDNKKFLNNTAFSILQAVRTRISKTEYISCPSCGRTLFDLQETTAKIRNVTSHLKGLKIAIMGCIVNGPGEMADADFGYVGSGPGKITLYKGKEVVKRNINSNIAVEELINLLKENNVWLEPANVLQ